jgi:hypothetical protein
MKINYFYGAIMLASDRSLQHTVLNEKLIIFHVSTKQ